MRKKIAITSGDPAGVGPEVSLKAILSKKLPKNSEVFIIGDSEIIKQHAKLCGIKTEFNSNYNLNNFDIDKINILDMKSLSKENYRIAEVSKESGQASYDYIIKGINLAKSSKIDAVVTAPINKTALKVAGINYPGHTEIFAEETNTDNYSMMFMLENVCVTHVTTHCSLKESIELIKPQRVLNSIILLNDTLRSLGIKKPRVAVAGLNPHAGEGGLFGTEEIDSIIPAIKSATEQGVVVSGPFPPDTLFSRAFAGEFDGVVSMIHDHGFVALKSKDFEHGVNITIGLPIIRTSVGHGTAFDIAGKGIASETSMLSAIDAAYLLATNRSI